MSKHPHRFLQRGEQVIDQLPEQQVARGERQSQCIDLILKVQSALDRAGLNMAKAKARLVETGVALTISSLSDVTPYKTGERVEAIIDVLTGTGMLGDGLMTEQTQTTITITMTFDADRVSQILKGESV